MGAERVKVRFSEKPVTVNILPHIREEERPGLASLWPQFQSRRLPRNIAILKQVASEASNVLASQTFDDNSKTSAALVKFINRVAFHQNLYENYKNRLPNFPKARLGLESLEDILVTSGKHGIGKTIRRCVHGLDFLHRRPKNVDLKDMIKYIKKLMIRSKGDVFIASDSHITMYHQIQALHELGYRDMGLMIFDRHYDFYRTLADTKQINPKKIGLGKANFLYHLLRGGVLNATAIIGVPQTNRDDMVLGQNGYGRGEFLPTHTFYNQHTDRIDIADPRKYTRYANNSKTVDTSTFVQEVDRQLEFLRQTGVKHVLLSFDVDVLQTRKMGYTAMEYNPLAHLLPIASQDLRKIRRLTGKNQGNELDILLAKIYTLSKVLYVPGYSSDFAIKRLGKDGKANIEHVNLRSATNEGIPLTAMLHTVHFIRQRCQELGMEFGVSLRRGGRYIGDITELSVQDYRGRTSKAGKEFIRAAVA